MSDFRLAFRQLAKTPGFTAVALLTLAIGIGSCTAIFSIVDAVLLKPLHYPHPEQLVLLQESDPPELPTFSVSVGDFATWRAQSTSFQEMAARTGMSANLTGLGEPVRVGGLKVTANFLRTLGVTPVLGRDFLPGEDVPGHGDVAILSYGFWSTQFGGKPDVIGQTLHIDGEPYTVVGVAPQYYQMPALMVPTTFTPAEIANHGSHYILAIGRLKDGVTLAQANSELALISAQLAKDFPNSNKGWTVLMNPLREAQVGRIRPQLYALLAAVGFLLFIGCTNVANLLLVRAAGRSREIAIRSAVGASRSRVVRQLVVEHLVLSLIGGLLGALVAYWGVHALISLAPSGIPRSSEIRVDSVALAFSVALSLLTGLVFGVVPAMQASRVDLNTVLKDAGRGTSEGRQGHRIRNALVMAELAIAVVLLVGAGLLMRSFIRLSHVDPGFRTDSAYQFHVTLAAKKYPDAPRQVSFVSQSLEKLGEIPGVTSAAAALAMPFDNDDVENVAIEGSSVAIADRPSANYYSVSPSFIKTLGIPLVSGRLFTEADDAKAAKVTLVSASFAKRFFPGQDAVGKRVNIQNPEGVWSTIVGVVGDVKQYGLNQGAPAEAYEPYAQHPDTWINFVLRVSGNPPGLSGAVRSAIASVDRDQPADNVRPLSDLIEGSVASERFAMRLLMVFSAVALLLATIGIHGVMASSVSQRTSEIGVRMALGANPSDVLRMVALQGLTLIAIGIAGGLVGALVLSRVISSMLFEVGALDPLTLAGACLVLGLAAFAACMLSAFRATRIDPIVALRGN